MIRNDDELAVVRKQLVRLAGALTALRRGVLPTNKHNYEVLSEGYVDQIAALRAKISEYRSGKDGTRRKRRAKI